MTAEQTEVIDPCTICGKPKADHKYIHQWIGYGSPNSLVPHSPELNGRRIRTDASQGENPSTQGKPGKPLVSDPVLRMALLRKGLITVEDLDAVEAELNGAGVAYFDPETLGQSRDR